MAITVTATQTGAGGTDNGIALTVKVITGQAASPIGTVANTITATTPELAITPSGTGSLVYGAVVNAAADTTFTAAGTTTFSANISDTTNGLAYGTIRSTSTTTSGTPVTLGATAPTETSGFLGVALCEILKLTTLAEDASSPAVVDSLTAITVTTASFTPPAGSLLVAMVSCNGSANNVNSMVMSVTTSGVTWTSRAIAALSTGSATYQLASVWTASLSVAHTATASLAVTPVRSAAALVTGPLFRTASLAVTPARSVTAAVSGPHTRTASLTAVPALSATAQHASASSKFPGSYAVPGATQPGRARPGHSITGTGPASHNVTASLAVTPARSAAARVSGPHSRTASLAVTPARSVTAAVTGPLFRTASLAVIPSLHNTIVHVRAGGQFTYLGYEDLTCFNYTPAGGGCLVLIPGDAYNLNAPALFQLRGHPYFGRTDYSPSGL